MKLDGSAAWVVGASSGIGAAVAEELTRRGATVAISARREDELQKVSDGRMLVVPLDVTQPVDVASAAARVRAELGDLDLVISSAGYWKQLNPRAWDADLVARHFAVNVTGTSNVIGAVLPDMLARGHGTFAGVASVAGFRGMPGAAAYGATKAALINMLESLRVQVRPSGVNVTTVCPGFVKTALVEQNDFRMPFMVSADVAARAICDGLEHDKQEIVFPWQMAALAKAARYVPVRAWTALWARPATRSMRSKR